MPRDNDAYHDHVQALAERRLQEWRDKLAAGEAGAMADLCEVVSQRLTSVVCGELFAKALQGSDEFAALAAKAMLEQCLSDARTETDDYVKACAADPYVPSIDGDTW